MNRKIIFLAILALLLIPSSVQAGLDPYAPELSFEMAVEKMLYIDDPSSNLALMAFHESSQNWVLFFRHHDNDIFPYDNLTLTIECNDESPAEFNTTEYQDWVDEGILSIEFPYVDDGYVISYNTVEFTGKYSDCLLAVDDFSGSYVNNSLSYDYIYVEMIPFLSAMEFLFCDDVDSAELSILSELSSVVTISTDVWNILWLIYSLFIVIFAVFMIPIFMFIMMRWAIYRLTGFKLVERKDRGEIST